MSQSPPTIGANKTGLQYRTEDNARAKAAITLNKGATAPDYAEAGVLWLDDSATPWLLKMHDGADWIVVGGINAANNTFSPYHGAGPVRLLGYAADTGAVNAYAIAPQPQILGYSAGQIVHFIPAVSNTGPSTISVNGYAAKNILMPDGSNVTAGVLKAGAAMALLYNGAAFIVLNPVISFGTAAFKDTGAAVGNVVEIIDVGGSPGLPVLRADNLTGIPVPPSTFELISYAEVSGSPAAFVDMELPAGYSLFRLVGKDINSTTGTTQILIRASSNGTVFPTTAYSGFDQVGTGTMVANSSGMKAGQALSSAASRGCLVADISRSSLAGLMIRGALFSGGQVANFLGGHSLSFATATHIRVLIEVYSLAVGSKFYLYGYKES